jgi:predicted DsbA family dithiol-disulfide isomerase
MNTILIIGTIPPCPRCGLLSEIVAKEVQLLGVEAEVRHIAYTSDEAKEISRTQGLEPGTAKEVAKKLGMEINLGENSSDQMTQYARLNETLDPNLKEFEKLFKKVAILDNLLRPYENMAKETGFLMTPVLIINGEIKHQGSVPSVAMIENWLAKLKR